MVDGSIQKAASKDEVARALKFAGLQQDSLSRGSHPDTGRQSWVLDGTIQQYSAFLVALAIQFRFASALEPIIDSVQVENRPDGDTLFWINGLTVYA